MTDENKLSWINTIFLVCGIITVTAVLSSCFAAAGFSLKEAQDIHKVRNFVNGATTYEEVQKALGEPNYEIWHANHGEIVEKWIMGEPERTPNPVYITILYTSDKIVADNLVAYRWLNTDEKYSNKWLKANGFTKR